MIYHSLKIFIYNAETTLGEMKLSLWCCKPELAQTHKGNCIKLAHLCFLILYSKTLQIANELTYQILCNSSSQQSISELLTEVSQPKAIVSEPLYASLQVFTEEKISCFLLMFVYIYTFITFQRG